MQNLYANDIYLPDPFASVLHGVHLLVPHDGAPHVLYQDHHCDNLHRRTNHMSTLLDCADHYHLLLQEAIIAELDPLFQLAAALWRRTVW